MDGTLNDSIFSPSEITKSVNVPPMSVLICIINVTSFVFDDMKNFFWDYSIGGNCASAGPC